MKLKKIRTEPDKERNTNTISTKELKKWEILGITEKEAKIWKALSIPLDEAANWHSLLRSSSLVGRLEITCLDNKKITITGFKELK